MRKVSDDLQKQQTRNYSVPNREYLCFSAFYFFFKFYMHVKLQHPQLLLSGIQHFKLST